MDDLDDDAILEEKSAYKRRKAVATNSGDDELGRILARRAERAKTEEQLRKQEAAKDDLLLIKEVFDKEDRHLIEKVGQAMEAQETAKAKLLRGDGPPPYGFFDFAFPYSGDAIDIPAIAVDNAGLSNLSFLANAIQSKQPVQSDVLDFLMARIANAPSDEVSTGGADTIIALLAGDSSGSLLHSTWLRTKLHPKKVLSEAFVDGAWRAETRKVNHVLQKYCRESEEKPEQISRYMSVLRTCVCLDKVQSPRELFCCLIKFSCFERSKSAHSQIRLILSDLVKQESVGDLHALGSDEVTRICMGDFEGSPRPAHVKTDFQSIVHRTVTLAGLMASEEPSLTQVLRAFLQKMVVETLLVGYAEQVLSKDEHDMFEIGEQEFAKTDPIVRAVFAFLRHDIDLVQTLERPRMVPSLYQTWLSLAKLAEYVTGNETCNRATRSFTSKQARYIANTAENVLMDAYMCLIDYLRFLDYLSGHEVKLGMTQTDMHCFLKSSE